MGAGHQRRLLASRPGLHPTAVPQMRRPAATTARRGRLPGVPEAGRRCGRGQSRGTVRWDVSAHYSCLQVRRPTVAGGTTGLAASAPGGRPPCAHRPAGAGAAALVSAPCARLQPGRRSGGPPWRTGGPRVAPDGPHRDVSHAAVGPPPCQRSRSLRAAVTAVARSRRPSRPAGGGIDHARRRRLHDWGNAAGLRTGAQAGGSPTHRGAHAGESLDVTASTTAAVTTVSDCSPSTVTQRSSDASRR